MEFAWTKLFQEGKETKQIVRYGYVWDVGIFTDRYISLTTKKNCFLKAQKIIERNIITFPGKFLRINAWHISGFIFGALRSFDQYKSNIDVAMATKIYQTTPSGLNFLDI